MKIYYIYMLTNWNKSVIYTGVTTDLDRSVYEHKNQLVKGPFAKYNLSKLVYIETTNFREYALYRDNEIKGMHRQQKDRLIESSNPIWDDLEVLQHALTASEAA